MWETTLLKHFYPLAALQFSSLCLCSDLTVCAFYLTLRIPWLKGNAQCWLSNKLASTDYLCFDTLLNSGEMTVTTPLGHISNEGGRCRNWYFQVERLWDTAALTQAYCWLEVLTSQQRRVSPHRRLQSDQQSGTRGGAGWEVVSEEHGGRTARRPVRGAALQRMTSLPTASDSWGPSHENWQGKTDLFKQNLSLSVQHWLMFNTGVQPGSRAIAWVCAFQALAEVQMVEWVTDHTESPHPQAGFHYLWVWFLFLLVCLCLPLLCVISCTLWTHTLWIFNFIKPIFHLMQHLLHDHGLPELQTDGYTTLCSIFIPLPLQDISISTLVPDGPKDHNLVPSPGQEMVKADFTSIKTYWACV